MTEDTEHIVASNIANIAFHNLMRNYNSDESLKLEEFISFQKELQDSIKVALAIYDDALNAVRKRR